MPAPRVSPPPPHPPHTRTSLSARPHAALRRCGPLLERAQVRAEQKNKALGQVGEPRSVRTELLENLLDGGVVPVVAPIAVGDDGASYNVNADTMAGAIATALQARCLLLLTDVAGVLDGEGTLLPSLTLADVSRLVDEGVVSGGMIPKLETATSAASGGVGSAVVMDGRVPHCSLVHFFGEGGVGTAVVGGD